MSSGKQDKKVLPEFAMDNLGTSFEVVLVNSAWEDGKDIVVPDEFALHKIIARQRALDPRKLTGGDIKYLRKSLGLKAKDLANALDISAEFLSRCEAGEKVMSSQIEKMLRLIVLNELVLLAERAADLGGQVLPPSFVSRWMADVRQIISGMQITPVVSADRKAVYRFERTATRMSSPARVEHKLAIANQDEWQKTQLACCVG